MTQHTSDDAESAEDPDAGREGGSITVTLGDRELVLRQRFELLSIINDIGICLTFTIGSVAFFWHELFNVGVTLFVVGSAELGVRPGIRLARRVQLRRVTKGMPHEVARDF